MYHGLSCSEAVKNLNKKFKEQIRHQGGLGFRNLSRVLRWYDFDRNGKLNIEEFANALQAQK